MDANSYQQEARRTLIDKPDREIPQHELEMIWAALQISIASGRLVEYLKKAIFHQHGLNSDVFYSALQSIIELVGDLVVEPELPENLTGEQIMELWVTTGLVGEASEVAEMLVISLVSGKAISDSEFSKELGDLGWYWASRATQRGLLLDDVLEGNVDKLRKRYQNGYSSEASRNREVE